VLGIGYQNQNNAIHQPPPPLFLNLPCRALTIDFPHSLNEKRHFLKIFIKIPIGCQLNINNNSLNEKRHFLKIFIKIPIGCQLNIDPPPVYNF
jgi:hypothetical protein